MRAWLKGASALRRLDEEGCKPACQLELASYVQQQSSDNTQAGQDINV
jgi:hypothetical protein